MKNFLLLTIFIAIVSLGFSQTFSVARLDGTPINDNDIITFNNIGDDANLVTIITNNGSGSLILKLITETITGTSGSDMEFCFGSCFWGIAQGTVYGPVEIAAGASTSSSDVHFHNHSTESDVITYVFKIYEEGNESNAFHFTYKYDVNYVSGVDNVIDSKFSVYPNPAKDFVNVSGEKKYDEIIFSSISGQIVKKVSSKKQISTSEFANGMYFYSIKTDNKTVKTGKIIINK